jgi:hypothetical protein
MKPNGECHGRKSRDYSIAASAMARSDRGVTVLQPHSTVPTFPVLNPARDHVHGPFTRMNLFRRQRPVHRANVESTEQDVDVPNDFDQIAIVIDWLDACRMRNLDALLDLYAPDARLECECGGSKVHAGRAGLESYWRPRLDMFSPAAFGVNEIIPAADGVVLDYLSFESKPVRIVFSFNREGQILRSRCTPSTGQSQR